MSNLTFAIHLEASYTIFQARRAVTGFRIVNARHFFLQYFPHGFCLGLHCRYCQELAA